MFSKYTYVSVKNCANVHKELCILMFANCKSTCKLILLTAIVYLHCTFFCIPHRIVKICTYSHNGAKPSRSHLTLYSLHYILKQNCFHTGFLIVFLSWKVPKIHTQESIGEFISNSMGLQVFQVLSVIHIVFGKTGTVEGQKF